MKLKQITNFSIIKKLKANGILSMNGRNLLYIKPYNKRKYYPLVDQKASVKSLAERHNISCPKLLGIIKYYHQVKNFDKIINNYKSFVIKPNQGSGGRGILVIKDRQGNNFIKTDGSQISKSEIKRHISNILSGLFSLCGKCDFALFEEFISLSTCFNDYSYQGVPDVRIIVYKGFPVMAMLRVATANSQGRANLHQGAIGIGISIQTGKALAAIQKNRLIEQHPDTGKYFNEVKIPFWNEHLSIAAESFNISKLGFIGVDIVLDEYQGPMLLEINARPGLAIQLANMCGLKKRLELIDSLKKENYQSVKNKITFALENFNN